MFRIVFHGSGYATVYLVDKELFDIEFSHGIHANDVQSARDLARLFVEAANHQSLIGEFDDQQANDRHESGNAEILPFVG